MLTLVGGSGDCAVRLPGPGISRFVCALLRTPAGVWAIDLLSSRGLAINGVERREAVLEDGDMLQVGGWPSASTYGGPTAPPVRPPCPGRPDRSSGPGATGRETVRSCRS